MRTDSVRVSDDAINEVREQIGELHGSDYVPENLECLQDEKQCTGRARSDTPNLCRALRPDKINISCLRISLEYMKLIWKRFVASQMKPQVLSITTVNVNAGPYVLRATGNIVKFDGFTVLSQREQRRRRRRRSWIGAR